MSRHPLPLAWASSGVWLGAWIALQAPQVADGTWVVMAASAGATLAVLVGWWICRMRSPWAHQHALRRGVGLGPGVALACAFALLCWAMVHARSMQGLQDRLDARLEGLDLWVEAVIDEMPVIRPDGVRFRVRPVGPARLSAGRLTPHAAAAVPMALPERLQLAWYAGTDAPPPPTLRAGQRWHLPVRLKRPHGAMNPQAFDTELWLFEQGLGATGAVRGVDSTQARLLGTESAHWVERLRQTWRDALRARVADPAAGAVLAALAVGDQAGIERDDWAVFRRTGVAHLVSISGVHVTMFAWLVGGAAGWWWRRDPRRLLRWPVGRVASVVGVLAAAAYALLAGWGVPAQRTVWMLACWAAVQANGWRWPWPRTLMAAAVVVVLADPWALLQAGFWLSFGAVALLMSQESASASDVRSAPTSEPDLMLADSGKRTGRAPWGWSTHVTNGLAQAGGSLRATVRLQVLTSVGLAPLTLLFFQQVSGVGLLANLVAIPCVTLLITPLALLGAIAPPLWDVGAWVVGVWMQSLAAMSAWPGASWQAAAAPLWLQMAGVMGGVLFISPLPWAWRAMGLPLILAMALPPPHGPPPGHFDLWAADIGQGNAVLVRTRHHALLYDTGPRYWREGDAGERVLAPLLRCFGVRRLDVMMLSHRDADHVGGAASVAHEIEVIRTMSSLEPGHPLRRIGPHQSCTAGLSWTWDGVRFDVLHPSADRLAGAAALLADPALAGMKPNTLSCLLKVSDGQRSALLTGDIERAQELALVEAAPSQALRADVMMVPHHGSRTSSSEAFVRAVSPQVALVQAGYRNRFGHPVDEVLARYTAIGASVVRSDHCGAWWWSSDTGLGQCERHARRRAWHACEGPTDVCGLTPWP